MKTKKLNLYLLSGLLLYSSVYLNAETPSSSLRSKKITSTDNCAFRKNNENCVPHANELLREKSLMKNNPSEMQPLSNSSKEVQKIKIDSVVSYNGLSSLTYSYNTKKLCDTIFEYGVLDGSQFLFGKKSLKYDEKDRLVETVLHDAIEPLELGITMPTNMLSTTYNEYNLPILEESFSQPLPLTATSGQVKNEWVLGAVKTHTYNANRLLEYSIEKKSINDSPLLNYGKNEYLYDNNDRLIKSIWSLPSPTNNEEWTVYVTRILKYDEKGRVLTDEETYVENGETLNSAQAIASYNDQDRLVEEIILYGVGQAWDTVYKYEYEYTNSGILIKESVFEWEPNLREWGVFQKWEYILDENEAIIKHVLSKFRRGKWYPDYRENFTHYIPLSPNSQIQLVEGVFFDYFWEFGDKMADGRINFAPASCESYRYDYASNAEEGSIEDRLLHFAYYSPLEGVSIREEKDAVNFTVYPNPTIDYININIENIERYHAEIYNMQGQLLLSVNAANTIPLQNYKSGAYILLLKTKEGRILSKKTIIKQ